MTSDELPCGDSPLAATGSPCGKDIVGCAHGGSVATHGAQRAGPMVVRVEFRWARVTMVLSGR